MFGTNLSQKSSAMKISSYLDLSLKLDTIHLFLRDSGLNQSVSDLAISFIASLEAFPRGDATSLVKIESTRAPPVQARLHCHQLSEVLAAQIAESQSKFQDTVIMMDCNQ